jgi:hypothetical protein
LKLKPVEVRQSDVQQEAAGRKNFNDGKEILRGGKCLDLPPPYEFFQGFPALAHRYIVVDNEYNGPDMRKGSGL